MILALLAPSATAVLATVTKTYASVTNLSADLTETVTNVTFGTNKVSNGKLALERPNKMRFDYFYAGKKTIKTTILADGKNIWRIDHQNLTIDQIAQTSSTLPVAVAFLNGGTAGYTVSLGTARGGTGTTTLVLVPKQASTVQQLILVVDATGQVTESAVVDAQGNTEDFVFSNVNIKTPIPASTFTFNPNTLPNYKVTTIPATAPPSQVLSPTTPPPPPPASLPKP